MFGNIRFRAGEQAAQYDQCGVRDRAPQAQASSGVATKKCRHPAAARAAATGTAPNP